METFTKTILMLLAVLPATNASGEIVSVGSIYGSNTITRDTATGLDWLDVTITRGLSYNEVSAELGSGGDYEGFRYASTSELEGLITNFGYVAQTTCSSGAAFCDSNLDTDNVVIEQMILTLGDVARDYYLEVWGPYTGENTTGLFFLSDGIGYTNGMLADHPSEQTPTANYAGSAYIFDMEGRIDYLGNPVADRDDAVESHGVPEPYYVASPTIGSFLVRPSEVPVPAAAWLLGSALLGLGAVKRKRA